jgi:hypothetical protein
MRLRLWSVTTHLQLLIGILVGGDWGGQQKTALLATRKRGGRDCGPWFTSSRPRPRNGGATSLSHVELGDQTEDEEEDEYEEFKST